MKYKKIIYSLLIILSLSTIMINFDGQLFNADNSNHTVYAARHGKRKAAFYYARRYWHHANTRKYGGRFREDCTNYASQIMNTKHGRTWGWHLYKWARKLGYTWPWINVRYFWSYWTGNRRFRHATFKTQYSVRKYAREGDIIQFYDRRGGWFHTVVVHYKTRYDIYYTSHKSDYIHKGLRHANSGRHGRSRITKYRVIHMGF